MFFFFFFWAKSISLKNREVCLQNAVSDHPFSSFKTNQLVLICTYSNFMTTTVCMRIITWADSEGVRVGASIEPPPHAPFNSKVHLINLIPNLPKYSHPLLFTPPSGSPFYYLWMCIKLLDVAHSVDPDQTPLSVASDLGLHCLLRIVFPNT